MVAEPRRAGKRLWLMPGMNAVHDVGLDLNLLAVFDAMFREGSVTRAALSLGTTQSAASHALNRLRGFFDDRLFVKAGQRMVPTRKAEAMRAAVEEVMTTIRHRVLSSACFDPARANRTFTLCMTDMGELVFLPPLLERFKREAPGCLLRTLQMPLEMIEPLLASGEADLALGSIRSAPAGLMQQRLFLHSFATIVSSRNRLVGERLTRRQFESLPHIVVSLTGRSSEAYDQVIVEQGVARKVGVITPHFLMVPLLMDRHPDLIATVPRELANVFVRLNMVRAFEPPVPVPPFALNQHWHPRFHHDPAIVWLRELTKRTFEHYPRVVTRDEPKGAAAASPTVRAVRSSATGSAFPGRDRGTETRRRRR
jgi:DNA-binding transcriptional LysR family regulator